MGTYPPHTRPNYIKRRLQRLQRVLRSTISPPGFDYPPANTTASCYWVGAVSNDWDNANNWSASSGGAGGYGVPTITNPVVFDGTSGGTFLCYLHRDTQCAAFSVTEADAAVAAEFNQNGYTLTCTTFTYNVPTANSGEVFDGSIYVSGATFTITAAENADHFGTATVYSTAAAGFTVSSAVALTGVTFSVGGTAFVAATALSVGRLIMSSTATKTMEFLNGVDFTLAAYTVGDWDGGSGAINSITSDDATTWGFVNPAAMVVAYINVQDSNATNAIDATDNCVDGTGNTNWTFV